MDSKIDGLYLQLEDIDNAIVDMLRERAGLVSGFDGLDGAESAALERRVLASAADRAGDELSDCAEAVFRAVTVSDRSLKNRRAGRQVNADHALHPVQRFMLAHPYGHRAILMPLDLVLRRHKG